MTPETLPTALENAGVSTANLTAPQALPSCFPSWVVVIAAAVERLRTSITRSDHVALSPTAVVCTGGAPGNSLSTWAMKVFSSQLFTAHPVSIVEPRTPS